ncbi:MAG: tetratricopeptide repeat protein [Planctomycetes bacterium]|nr:tetratricopeptide repeat protein [Planctomycetota bacterium]
MADVSRFITKADEALKKRNYDYAIQMYVSAMEADPGNVDAHRNYRLALVRKYDQDGYPKGIGLGGLKTIAVSKNPEKLLIETEKLVGKDPKGIKYNLRSAEALMMLNKTEAALAVLEFTAKTADIKSDKQTPQLFSLLAKCYSETGKMQEANQMLSRAVKLSPNDKQLQALQKEIAAKSYNKQFGSATSSYELVKNRDEADKLEKMRKGVITEEDADSLLVEEEQKLKENPLDRRAIRNIGEILAKRKKYKEAHDRLKAFCEVDSSATEVGDKAAEYMNLHYDNQIQICLKRAQTEPDKAAAYKAHAEKVREEKKKFQLVEFGRQVEAAPTDLEKRYMFGKALYDAGDHQEAFKHFQKAVKSPKFSKKAGVMMGDCLLRMGRLEMAEMAFQGVHKELGEGDEDLRKDLMYLEADLMQAKGDTGGALNRFRELYMEDMEFRDVEKRIEQLKQASGAA